jgi:hypothetical protein
MEMKRILNFKKKEEGKTKDIYLKIKEIFFAKC